MAKPPEALYGYYVCHNHGNTRVLQYHVVSALEYAVASWYKYGDKEVFLKILRIVTVSAWLFATQILMINYRVEPRL